MSVGKRTQRQAVLLLLLLGCGAAVASGQANPKENAGSNSRSNSSQAANLHYVRSFSSVRDVQPSFHPILDKTLDIIAGPADPAPRIDSLQSPAAVIEDSKQRVFVADPGAKAVHIFDFGRSKYGLLDADGERLGSPLALALDGEDSLYVTEANSRTILVYDAAGKFRRRLGELQGGESYFEDPQGIAIDHTTGRIYVCDAHRHMVVVMDGRGRLITLIGKRGGGDKPGEFRFPTQVVARNGELFVLDMGNRRVQIFDLAGKFRRDFHLIFADHNTGLAVDRELNIYATDPVLKIIQVFNHDGRPLYTSDPTTSPEGEFSRPSSLWVSAEDCLYVVDSGNRRRISVFQIGEKDARHCR